jgi:hypothetical protein
MILSEFFGIVNKFINTWWDMLRCKIFRIYKNLILLYMAHTPKNWALYLPNLHDILALVSVIGTALISLKIEEISAYVYVSGPKRMSL